MKWDKAIAFFKSKGKYNWLFAIGLLGILLIGLSGVLSGGEVSNNETSSVTVSSEQYAANLENQLCDMLQHVDGVGKCKVMVTIDQGTEYIYATQEKNSKNTIETSEDNKFSAENESADEETYIMVETDNGEQPLLITQLSPKVKGVVVVCGGGDNPAVCQKVCKAVATALHISETRICVIQGTIS